MNEVNQFLKDTEQQNQELDILDQPLYPEGQEPAAEAGQEEDTTAEDAPTGADDEEEEPTEIKPKNRRERRLRARLDSERSAGIQMAETIQNLTKANKSIDEADYLKGLDQIYGNETPEAIMAGKLLREAIVGVGKDAEERAYQRIAQERQQEAQQQQAAQAELDGFIDDIEDTYNVEFTEPQEKSFFQLLYKMSPKDANGNVVGYADPHAVYEVFKDRTTKKAKPATQAKKIASRSLKQGGGQEKSTVQEDSTVRFLKENGII